MKKVSLIFSLLFGGLFCLHAQSAGTPKLAPYAVNDSVAAHQTSHTVIAQLAPTAKDSSADIQTQTSIPELREFKMDDPHQVPKQ